MTICSQCVLDEKYPGIKFNEEGVCNYCTGEKKRAVSDDKRSEFELKFKDLIATHRDKGPYDAIVAYSGGKDSTYTMHLLKEKYDLNILAFTVDNWFFSDRAHTNIKNVIKAMGVDHINFRPKFNDYLDIIKASANNDMYSLKAMQRSSAICTSCISLVRYLSFQMAIEKSIPFVIFGMSPGQAPIATSVVKTNSKMIRQSQKSILESLKKYTGDIASRYFLSEEHFKQEEKFPYSINPLAFYDYNEENIYEIIKQYNWEKPKDTDANSSNCLLNAYANKKHYERYKINPYAYEVAGLVRNGAISRAEGLKRLGEDNSGSSVLISVEEIIDNRK